MKHLIILTSVLVISSANTVNYCGQNSCCSTPSCNSCANNCRYQCQSEMCSNNCINNCVQTIPQTCSSGTCNACSESQCCNSQSCNTCANTCASQCTTQVCKSACVNTCAQAPTSCAGGSCNACSGNQCCSSSHCNQCANTCTNQCSTQTCKDNCINKCIQTSPSCQGQNCNNVCVGGQCCNNQNCNTCVNQCYNQGSGCTRSCVRDCIQPDPIKIHVPIPERECNNLHFEKGSTSDERTSSSDVKTNVDLNNIINNTNRIYVPIRINNTNINNVHYPKRSKDIKPIPKPDVDVGEVDKEKTKKKDEKLKDGCCYVLHPRECFETPTGPRCQRRRHHECSAICTSDVVVISAVQQTVHANQPYPMPYPGGNQQCHYMQQYPYVYCGNYQKLNCGNCYNCGQGQQPQSSILNPQCSAGCRNSLL